ncbi:hypothetical protein CDAR_448211 [Caerostris darwini]|uniref:Uncharacterized protein n=1 Tax=Caerostris darwini TaxID=1538125 RepID=A0AAV4SHC6_9ARAC|nr:hypothetical protein CDAR_448211 [Caerostris darwini]
MTKPNENRDIPRKKSPTKQQKNALNNDLFLPFLAKHNKAYLITNAQTKDGVGLSGHPDTRIRLHLMGRGEDTIHGLSCQGRLMRSNGPSR